MNRFHAVCVVIALAFLPVIADAVNDTAPVQTEGIDTAIGWQNRDSQRQKNWMASIFAGLSADSMVYGSGAIAIGDSLATSAGAKTFKPLQPHTGIGIGGGFDQDLLVRVWWPKVAAFQDLRLYALQSMGFSRLYCDSCRFINDSGVGVTGYGYMLVKRLQGPLWQ